MKTLFAVFFVIGARIGFAQDVLPLYPERIPNSIEVPDEEQVRDPKEPHQFLLNTSRPTLTVYLPSRGKPTPAVLIFPGGSYRGTSIIKEGREVAVAFNKMGVAAIVVKYRTPSEKWMTNRSTGPLQDAQQAMRVVRTRAEEWNIDAARVGVVGFSAGGHLAATAAVRFDKSVNPAPRNENLRPDFLVLVYPVVSMTDELAHTLSRTNLLGDSPSPEAMRNFSVELTIPERAPPTFLVHAADDKTVKVENTLRLFEALKARGIPTELHIYPGGGHGFGLNNSTTQDRWIEHCKNWLVSQGILTAQ
jgi:acetyl esterase/lipase